MKNILEQINEAKTTKILSLNECRITDEIWREIVKLADLRELYITNCEIGNVPENINNLTNLTSLKINACHLNDFPINFTLLKSLQNIVLQNNELTCIPEKLLDLPNLNSLILSINNISEIPDNIVSHKTLNYVELWGNPLDAIDFTFEVQLKKDKLSYKLTDLISRLKNELLENGIAIFRNNDMFFTIQTARNYAFIQIAPHNFLWTDEKKENFNTEIYVFGEKNNRSKLLSNIRSSVGRWLKNENFRIISRSFNYPIYNPNAYRRVFYGNNTSIDYDKLIKYKASGEKMYFDDTSDKKISVYELSEYIGAEDVKIERVWNGSDTISNLRIKNFKSFKDILFKVAERINILIGRNGLGKTSILQAITLGLLPLDNNDKSNEFESYISFEQQQSEITIRWGEEYRKTYLFNNKLDEEKYIDSPQKLLLAYGVNFNTDLKLDHSKIIEQIIKGTALPYSTKSIFKDYSTDFYDPIILLEKLQIENSKKDDKIIDDIIILITKSINNYLSLIEEKECISLEHENTDYFFKDINSYKLKTQHLSEGYKDHILLITDIIIRIISARNNIFDKVPMINRLFEECKGVILIDEFDRHLHPVWQRRFLLQLKNDFPKIQFILTTHNLFSLQSAEGFNSLILGLNENEVTVTEKPIKSGLSIESIYNMYFDGNNKFFGYETEELFKNFYELIVKMKRQEASENEINQFREITNQLVEKDEEVQVIISRELRQMERQTGKAFEL